MKTYLSKTIACAATGILALSFVVSGSLLRAQDSTQNNGKTSPTQTALSSADKTFLTMANQSNLAEIKTSQLALKKASQQGIKDFAQKMVDDHTKAEDELKQLASTKGVTLPDDPGAKNKAAYNKLTKLSGSSFVTNYTQIQKSGHDMTIAFFQKEINNGQDADVKAYAQKYLPAIQEHDKMITDMKMGGKMSSSTGTSSSGK